MSKVKMSPLPEKVVVDRHIPSGVRFYGWTYDQVEAHARANMEPLIAENERLAEALRELVEVFSESGMYDEEVFAKARVALTDHGDA